MDTPSLTKRIARLATLGDLIETHGIRAVSRGDDDRAMVLARRFGAVCDTLYPLLDEYDAAISDPPDNEPIIPEAAIEPRQHADGSGFTPFAWRHLLHDTGFASDHEVRPYILGGNVAKRVRIETRTTLTLAFQFYTGREDVTHLWVQYSDGKRHLVHRKGH